MPGLKIQGKEHQLNAVFSDKFAFEIPHFQRPYAWGGEETSELLEDLLRALGEDDDHAPEEAGPYFLGCLVLIKEHEDPAALVVDGQQRLTTLTILSSVLRASIADQGIADEITQYIYTKGQLTKGTKDHYRLTVRERDRAFFRDYIQKSGKIEALRTMDEARLDGDAQRRMRKNTLDLFDAVSALPAMRRQRLALYLLRCCVVVIVSSPDLDSAYRIFSVLNDRGLNLSATDILKAEVIGYLDGETEQRQYAQKWETWEDELGADNFQELFAHIRMIHAKRIISNLLREYREDILPTYATKNFVDDLIEPYAKVFEKLLDASFESTTHAETINDLLRWLGRIDNQDWIPPALAYLHANQDDPAKVKAFLQDLERLAAGMMIIRVNRTKRIDRYGKLLEAIESGESLVEPGCPLQLTAAEIDEIKHQLDGPIYELANVPRYVLLRVDSTLTEGEASYNLPIVSIEHVLPQTPAAGSDWLEKFPDEAARDAVVHRMGNLALLSRRKNSAARNYDFAKKKDSYFKDGGSTSFVLTRHIIEEGDWTPEVVERRQGEMTQKLRELWRLEHEPAAAATADRAAD